MWEFIFLIVQIVLVGDIVGTYIKIFFTFCLLLLMLPVCFASDDVDLNNTLSISEVNDYVLSENDGYNHIYVNSSASNVGDGSKESPYKELSSIYPGIQTNTVIHIADGYYKYNYNNSGQMVNFMQITSNVKFIGESAENTTIDFSGNGIFAFIEWRPNIYFKDIKLFNTSVNLISYNGQAQYGGTLEAENVIFDSAKSIAYNGAYYIGGAISCSGQLKLTDCIFKNNTADRGGAIFALIGGELKNCTFIDNKALFDGGAIFTPNYQMLIHDSKFINNTASREGGAIYAISSILLNNSDLRYNKAYSGGVVYIVNYQLAILNSNLINNYATSYGGAIIAINSPYFYIEGARFINDTSISSAGAIYSMYSKMYFYDSVFANCSSLIGGAICDLYSSALFSNLNFTNNSATKGGAVYKMYNTTSIMYSTFNSNHAHEGGGLYVDEVSSAILNNLTFNDNTADYGGDIYCLGNPNNINVTNSSSPDSFNMTLLDLNQRPEKYDIFEIENSPVVLDSRYDMREHYNLTEVKNQLEQGNCWAFAAMAALESCVVKANGTAYDFSEENLKNLVSRFSDYGNFASVPNSGGNFFMTIGYFASWLGPISEEEEIYSPNSLSLLYDAITHVQNVVFLPRMSYTDNDGIKEAIVKYGAVVTSMYYSDAYLANDKVSYYVNVGNLQTNHDVSIVGWDDNYSKEKFKTTPPGDGAFIVRNSWGPDWGENGYFYVSYYDLYFSRVGNIIQPSFTFVLNDTNHYDKNYQYEIQISNFATLQADTTSLGIGNSFLAESDELLSAVSTYFSDDSNYTISIYVNNQLKHSQQGNTTAGYFTIPLTKYVPIKKGDTFDVIFMITNLNNQKPLLYFFEYSKNSRFAIKGMSYYSDDYGKNWYSAFERLGGVIPVKGFTKYGKLNTTIEVSGWDCDWTINKDYMLQVRVKDSFGDYIDYGNVTFLIDDEPYTVKLINFTANMTVLFTHGGQHNITVLFNATDYYYPSNITKLIEAYPLNTSLSLSLSNDTLLVGDSLTVTAVVNATQGKVLFYINDVLNDTVDVDGEGVARLVLDNLYYGSYNVTAVFTDDKGGYLNSSNKTSFDVFLKTFVEVNGWDCDWTINRNYTLQVRVKDQLGEYVDYGNVTFLIDDEPYTVKLVDSVANKTVLFTQADQYNITVLFNAVDYYCSSNVSKLITINPVNTVLSLSLSNDTLLVGEPLTVTAVVNASQGKVLFYINDILNDTVDVNIDGLARLVLDNLYYGSYNVTAVFTDDKGTYLNSSNRSAFSVYSNTVPEVSGWDCDWTVNGNVTLQIRVKDQFGDYVDYGNVTFLIDDKPYTVKLVDSVANKTISFNQAGEHNITVLFNAVDYYCSSNVSKLITINPVNTVLSLSLSNDTLLVGEPLTVTAVVNASQGKVLFYINDILNDTVDVNIDGLARLVLDNLYYGSYNVTAVFTDDKGTYLNSSNRSAFSVYSNTVPEVSGWDCDWTVNGNVTLQVRVKDQFGDYIDDGDVVFLIDGKAYTVKLVDSVANKTVLFTQVGEHNITVLFNAVDYYYSSNITKLVDVSPLQTALSLSLDEDIIFIDDSLTATAVVNATQGKVSFYINGILNGTVDVDSDGVAVLTLSNLYYGEYNLTAVFSDDEGIYLNSSDKTEFTVFSMTFIEVSGWDCDWTINKNYTLQVRVKDQFGDYIKDGEVFFYIEGDAYTVELVDSVANKTISFTQAGQYDILVIFNTIDYYFFSYVIKLIDIKPVNTVLSLSLSNGTLLVGEPLTATAVVNATQGKVSFYINGVLNDTVGVDSDGVAVLTLNNLKSGDYNITAVFTDDNGTYLNSSDKASFTVIYPIKIITQDLTKYYNESDRFAARIIGYDGKGISNQKVEFTIENTTYESITDSKGYAYLTASLQPGDYIVKTIYEDLEASNLFTILPTLLDKDMNISSSDIYDDESEVINVVLPKDATGNVSTIVNGKKYSADVNKGVANISIPNLKDGNYNIEIIYSGNEKYNSVRGNTSFTVKKSQITISAPDVTKYYRGSERFIVTLKYNDKALNNATISININGMDYKRTTDENGVASMAINLDSGVYNVTVEYNSTKAYSTVTVKSTIVASDITKIFRNGTQYYAKFMDSQGNILKNTDVKFNINGVFYTRTTDEAGIVKLTINLNPGEYILTAINPSNGEQHANTIKVLSSIVENHDLIKYYKNASQFTFRLLDNQGNPVGAGVSAIININGVFYTRTTDANGYITLNINLNPGTYIATIEYNGLSLANTIKVLPILEAKDLRMKYRDGTKFEVKLLDGQGKPYAGQTITLNINGVFYDRITDNAGIARLNINLMPGEYIITSMYKNGAVISNKITISG